MTAVMRTVAVSRTAVAAAMRIGCSPACGASAAVILFRFCLGTRSGQ